jgi:beta-lactam-binding protein with PASTA domain
MLTNTAPTVMVPSVVGDTQSAATSAITGIGLVVGTPVTQQTSTTIAPGIVISQNPVANTTAIRDHPVR